jgi:hypothetical protein
MHSSTVSIPGTTEVRLCGTCNQDEHSAALLPSSGGEVRCPNPTHIAGWQRRAEDEARTATTQGEYDAALKEAAELALIARAVALAGEKAKGTARADVNVLFVRHEEARQARIVFLNRKLAATKADLLVKFEDDDYHGVSDAAMDLRDIVSELAGLEFEG